MQLHDFETFIYLYETRSINLTAKITGYAQSNITARLKKLRKNIDYCFSKEHIKG